MKLAERCRSRFAAGMAGLVSVGPISTLGRALWARPAPLPPEPPMPALSADLLELQDYYKFRFLPDGYPGKLDGEIVIAHPIYGRYVIEDYLRQFAKDRSPVLREAIRKVANAAITRMEPLRDSLVFFYPEEMPVSRQPDKHYSGLTQAYYAEVLYDASQATGDESLRLASEKAFRSLLIPQEDGGVYYAWEDGVALAEVPTSPRDLILNGWLSILRSVDRYAELTASTEARRLFDESAATVAKLLPLYDHAELRNSRYNLTGPVSLRLEFDSIDGVRVEGLLVDIAKEGTFPVPVASLGRWQYWVDPKTATALHGGFAPKNPMVSINVVLSRLSYPDENIVRFTVDTPQPIAVTLAARVGTYDPLKIEQSSKTWRPVRTVQLAAGRNQLAILLPWKTVDLIAYPTNFMKQIDGRNTNIYHVSHIVTLRTLEARTGNPVFGQWADRWQGYLCEWGTMPLYAGLSLREFRADRTEITADPATFCR